MKNSLALMLVVFTLTLLSTSCSRYVIRAPIDLDPMPKHTNALVKTMTRLELPDGWVFTRDDQKTKEGATAWVLFDFKDNVGNVSGFVQYKKTNARVSALAAGKWYAGVSKSQTDIELHSTMIGGREAYIMKSRMRNPERDCMAALIPGTGSGFDIIWMSADPGFFQNHAEVAYGVFASHRDESKSYSYRRVTKGMRFQCDDGDWSWSNDYHDGFYILNGKAVKVRCLIGLRTGDEFDSVRGTYEDGIAFDVPEFDPMIEIAGEQYRAEAIGTIPGEKEYYKISYLFERKGRKYVLFLGVNRNDTDRPPEEIHQIPEIVDALNNCISFD